MKGLRILLFFVLSSFALTEANAQYVEIQPNPSPFPDWNLECTIEIPIGYNGWIYKIYSYTDQDAPGQTQWASGVYGSGIANSGGFLLMNGQITVGSCSASLWGVELWIATTNGGYVEVTVPNGSYSGT